MYAKKYYDHVFDDSESVCRKKFRTSTPNPGYRSVDVIGPDTKIFDDDSRRYFVDIGYGDGVRIYIYLRQSLKTVFVPVISALLGLSCRRMINDDVISATTPPACAACIHFVECSARCFSLRIVRPRWFFLTGRHIVVINTVLN